MSLFHFHTRTPDHQRDDDGHDLASVTEAQHESVQMLGGMLRDDPKGFWADDDEWEIEVTDHRGLTLFRVTVITTRAPAMRH